MRRNPGHMPPEAAGKRVKGKLRNGQLFGHEPLSSTTPAGWAADGRYGCRWTLTGQPFDIWEYEVIR